LLLTGYGAYGLSYDPAFSSNTLSLLDRGFVVAIAHVRGGEELGRAWYEGGRLLNKQRTFSDFIAAAEHLVAAGYTAPDRLVINGGSAGGLLIGAVTNQRPDLFRAALAEVPFVDVINTMLDATLPLTVIEYDEWGNPNDAGAYRYIRSYSPYDNIAVQPYPHMLVTAGLNDPRVAYWEPAKWTAKLRVMKTDSNRLLLRTNMGAGHGGASGRYELLRETAFKYAFILDVLGLEEPGLPEG
jgi:oligopeptidase B